MSENPPNTFSLSERIQIVVATALGWGHFLRLLSRTWRIESDPSAFDAVKAGGGNLIGMLWHGRLAPFARPWGQRHIHVMISQHRDGELIARILRRFGFDSVRGSSTRGGASAAQRMVEVGKHHDLAITPDGPRGPRFSCAPGIVEVAGAARTPIWVAAVSSHPCWELPSWDRFMIPKPFARVRCRYEIVHVPPDLDEAARERLRRELEILLKRMTVELDRSFGRPVDPFLLETPEETEARREAELRERASRPRRPKARRGLKFAIGAAAAAAAIIAAPWLLRLGAAAAGRADLCAGLLVGCVLAAVAAPALVASRRLPALAGGFFGLFLATPVLGLTSGEGIGAALGGTVYVALVALLGVTVAARRPPGARGAVLGAAPGLALLGSIFAAGPLLGLLARGAHALPALLHASAVTAIAGSLLGIDVLRAAPLYTLVPAASDAPFAYPPFASTLVVPFIALILCLALDKRRPQP